MIGFPSVQYLLSISEFTFNENRSARIRSVRGIFLDIKKWIPRTKSSSIIYNHFMSRNLVDGLSRYRRAVPHVFCSKPPARSAPILGQISDDDGHWRVFAFWKGGCSWFSKLNAIKQSGRSSNLWKDYNLTDLLCFLNSPALLPFLKGKTLCNSIFKTFG